jgi:PIN domain nuclease of toxin-antitoxin system
MRAGELSGILLDTHVFLWSINEPEKLSRSARRVLEDPAITIHLSVASVWEMSLKTGKGKLDAPDSVVDSQVANLGIVSLPIRLSHIRALSRLLAAKNRKDPFDRLLAAQAITENMPLVTSDRAFAQYAPITLIW